MKQNKAIRQKLENVLYVITTWKMSYGHILFSEPIQALDFDYAHNHFSRVPFRFN